MRLNVGVLRGGVSPEYDYSLQSGGAILANLDREKYQPIDLLVDRLGILHADGLPIEPKKLRGLVDVVWNALHGGPGEDGTLQKIFNDLGLPQIGYGSEEVLDKVKTKKKIQDIKDIKIKTPHGLGFNLSVNLLADIEFDQFVQNTVKEVFERISPPWVVKPLKGGTAEEAMIAYNFSELFLAIKESFRKHQEILVEEFIKGRGVTLGLIEGLRGEEHYNVLPLQPKDLQNNEKAELQSVLREIKKQFGLKHYFTADFILTPRGAYLLEVDALPHLHENATLPRALAETGVQMPEFVEHCIKLAVKSRK